MLPDFRKYSAGFTLVELMIVTIIVGILASIAIPGYQKTIEKGYGDKAKVVLQTCYTAEKLYRLDYNEYGSLSDLINGKYIENPNTGGAKFSYSSYYDQPNNYEIRAWRGGKYLAINQNGPTQWTWPY